MKVDNLQVAAVVFALGIIVLCLCPGKAAFRCWSHSKQDRSIGQENLFFSEKKRFDFNLFFKRKIANTFPKWE